MKYHDRTIAQPVGPGRLSLLFCAIFGVASLAPLTTQGAASNSIARVWNERALAAIRVDTPHPPAQARNYFSLSVCMYDAWAAYDTNGAVGFIYHGKHTAPDIAAARSNAISYAAFRLLIERHVYSKTASNTLAADTNLMVSLGFDPNNNTRDTSTPTGVGNSIYDAVSAWFINDGSRQTNGQAYTNGNQATVTAYPDYPAPQGGYVYINPPLATDRPGIDDGFGNTTADINKWQRLQVVNAVDQNGFPQGSIQPYLGAQWLGVRPYQLARIDNTLPWVDPGPPPFYGGATHAQFVKEVVADIAASSQLTTDDGVTIDISPAVYGSNSLSYAGVYGADASLDNIYDGHGYPVNPITAQPYTNNVVKRGDYARVLSEFWADGPNSETPPGHWNVLANYVADSPSLVKKIGGVGPVVDDLEWDVKMYFALNAATHEAACACWAVKRFYNAWRPMSAVRYLGGLGQSSDPGLPSYNANGLPLITNLIELVTASTVASGRHTNLTVGKIAVLAWPGENSQRVVPNGVHYIHADTWTTYQKSNFVVPAFPGYISGHSTFSRSAAEVLAAITGSKFFPGGLGTFTFPANTALKNEKGPSQTITLGYATYYDAADGAGLSRIYGGIHPPVDNLGGRVVGEMTGQGVWEAARKYFDGSIANSPINLTFTKLNSSQGQVRYNTLRGMYYKLQTTPDLGQPFVDVPGSSILATNSSWPVKTNLTGPGTIFRAVRTLTP